MYVGGLGMLNPKLLRDAIQLVARVTSLYLLLNFQLQEVNLKLPGRGSRPIRTTIKEHRPWKLKQVWIPTHLERGKER